MSPDRVVAIAVALVLVGFAAVLPSRAETTHAKHAPAKVIRDPALGKDGMERMEYVLGQSIFERIWVSAPASTEAADGLGPMFNARSCVACHPAGARPLALQDEKGLLPSLLMRFGLKSGGPDPVYGGQLQNEAVAGVPAEGRRRRPDPFFNVGCAGDRKAGQQEQSQPEDRAPPRQCVRRWPSSGPRPYEHYRSPQLRCANQP